MEAIQAYRTSDGETFFDAGAALSQADIARIIFDHCKGHKNVTSNGQIYANTKRQEKGSNHESLVDLA